MKRSLFETSSRLGTSGGSAMADPSQLLGTISRSLDNAAQDQLREWQNAVLKESAEAGELAGTEGLPKYQEGTSLSAEAFNQAAKKSYMMQTETTASTKMAELAETFKSDPDGYLKESTKYIQGLTSEMKSKSQTAAQGNLFDARLKLQQQSVAYGISKNYMRAQTEKAKVETEELYQTVRNNTYRNAGGLFSNDPNQQALTLQEFALNKKVIDSALTAVAPDGTPVYSPKQVADLSNAFHKEFYTRAVQDYIAEADLNDDELDAVLDGKLKVDVPGLGKIDILEEVGVDSYERIKAYTATKLREKVTTQAKARSASEEALREAQKVTGTEVIMAINNGDAVGADVVSKLFRNGQISSADARVINKMINDPNTRTDDVDIVADLQTKIILGEDVTSAIKMNANRMSPNTFKSLMEDAAKAEQKDIDSNAGWLVRETVKKDAYGFDDPKSVRLAKDIVDGYKQLIKDGMEPTLAFEKARERIDYVREYENVGKYKSLPVYMEMHDDQTLNVEATMAKIRDAVMHGNMDMTEADIQVQRLEAMLSGEGNK